MAYAWSADMLSYEIRLSMEQGLIPASGGVLLDDQWVPHYSKMWRRHHLASHLDIQER